MTFKLAPEVESMPLSSDLLQVSQRIAKKDSTIWGPQSEAPTRLGWVDLPERSRRLLPQLDSIAALAKERDITELVLSGMGGSSLAPEVIAKSFATTTSRSLTIMDSTEPHFVESILSRDLSRTLFLISSKSGTTIETTSHLAAISATLTAAGIDWRQRIIVITDPGSALNEFAKREGLVTIHGESDVGGRFSALSAFGLTPAALINVDPSLLLDDAAEMLQAIHEPAVKIAKFLAPHRYLYFKDSSGRLPGLADWIEQLIAESTGKSGKGLLPIAILPDEVTNECQVIDLATIIDAPLGAHFILWEWVTALLGHIYEVDPFDQPDVQATKSKTLEALNERGSISSETLPIDRVESEVENASRDREYIAICAFLDPIRDQKAYSLRSILSRRFHLPVAFGWGPRFLHSTGQFHKGGPKKGLFLSLTIDGEQYAIPGNEFGFAELILAQAEGDSRALRESGGRVINVHLTKSADLDRLIEILDR